LKLIITDINRRFSKAYNADDLEIIITRDTMIDETENENREKVIAERKQIVINMILSAAPHLPSDKVIELICEQFELDYDDVQELLELEPYSKGLDDGTDDEVIIDGATG